MAAHGLSIKTALILRYWCIEILVSGTQYADAAIERVVTVHGLDGHQQPLTPQQARQLAAALIEAADEIDQLVT